MTSRSPIINEWEKHISQAGIKSHELAERARKTRVEWHQLVMFGKLTKVVEYLQKGSQVYVDGKLRSNQWTDGDGNTRHSLSIVVNNIQLLGQSKPADEAASKTAESHMAQMRDILQAESEDIPF